MRLTSSSTNVRSHGDGRSRRRLSKRDLGDDRVLLEDDTASSTIGLTLGRVDFDDLGQARDALGLDESARIRLKVSPKDLVHGQLETEDEPCRENGAKGARVQVSWGEARKGSWLLRRRQRGGRSASRNSSYVSINVRKQDCCAPPSRSRTRRSQRRPAPPSCPSILQRWPTRHPLRPQAEASSLSSKVSTGRASQPSVTSSTTRLTRPGRARDPGSSQVGPHAFVSLKHKD